MSSFKVSEKMFCNPEKCFKKHTHQHFWKKLLKKETINLVLLLKIIDNTNVFLPLNDPLTLKAFEKAGHVAVTLSWLCLHMFLGLEITPSG